MLRNNNMKICRKMARRELSFHRGRKILLTLCVALTAALYLFLFLTGSSVSQGVLYRYRQNFGSMSQILFQGLTRQQAESLAARPEIKSLVYTQTPGRLSDEKLDGRTVLLSGADQAYAKSIEAVPMQGRLPQHDGEIALDEMTMDSLGIAHRLGEKVGVSIQAQEQGGEQELSMTLCGYWTGAASEVTSVAWVTPSFAEEIAARLDEKNPSVFAAGVMLKQPGELEEQAEMLLTAIGGGEAAYTVNPAWDQIRAQNAGEMATPYYYPLPLGVLWGFFMIFLLLHLSVEADIRFYGRLKSLGMTPRQIKMVVWQQALIVCLPGIAAGFVPGFLLYLAVIPRVIQVDVGTAFKLLAVWPFAGAALLTWATALAAGYLPARRAYLVSAAEAVHFVCVPNKRKKIRRITITALAADRVKKQKARLIFTLFSMLCALLLLCTAWIRYVSYDEEIYLEYINCSDYQIMDASVRTSLQTYNPAGQSITDAFVSELIKLKAVTGYGAIRTMETDYHASDQVYLNVTGFYGDIGYEGITRQEEMSVYPQWESAYEKFLKEKTCKSVVIGAEGVALEKMIQERLTTEGTFDKSLFESGGYVVAVGPFAEGALSAAGAGEKIQLNGRTFTVMALCEIPTYMIPGQNSGEAAFSLDYILPMNAFLQMYPEANIRTLLFNTDPLSQEAVEEFLTSWQEKALYPLVIERRSDRQQEFHDSVFVDVGVDFLSGLVLALTGLLLFCDLLISETLERRREFAIYESLGMSRKQLTRLVTTEGILQSLLLFLFLTPVVLALTWFGMPLYYEASGQWAYTYRFTLTPLWVSAIAYILLSAVIPVSCLHFLDSKTIAGRLKEE